MTDATDRTNGGQGPGECGQFAHRLDQRVLIREKMIAYLQEQHPESLPRSRVELTPDGDTGKTT